jgi:hypothetical protein
MPTERSAGSAFDSRSALASARRQAVQQGEDQQHQDRRHQARQEVHHPTEELLGELAPGVGS